MALLELPPEILFLILSNLGSEFFTQDLGRLTVSKKWYPWAWKVMVRDLRFTSKTLIWFVEEGLFARSQPMAWGSSPARACRSNSHRRTAQLNLALSRLAAGLRKCRKLHSLTVMARSERFEDGGGRSYLLIKPLADLLSLQHLTSLEVDTLGSRAMTWKSTSGIHLCQSINALLPSLRRLRCRMDFMCGLLLALPNQTTPLDLEEVIINVSSSWPDDESIVRQYPRYCLTATSDADLGDAMIAQASKLPPRIRSPRIIWVIYRLLGRFERVFDAVSGERYPIPSRRSWVWAPDGAVV
ncbi:hypothetical protein VTK26DRAFT_8941 [Humicola hyalothermophila]